MKSKFNINNVLGSAIMIAILFANIAPVTVYAGEYGDDSNFGDASFDYSSNFGDSSFNYGSNFDDSSFNYGSNFNDSSFNYSSNFDDSSFNYGSNFNDSTFDYSSNFNDSSFNYGSNFDDASFNYGSNFNDASFNYGSTGSNFDDASFNYGSNFNDASFNYGSTASNFNDASFNYGSAGSNFNDASFNYGSNFNDASFNYGSTGSNFNDASFNYGTGQYATQPSVSSPYQAQQAARSYSQPSYSQPSYSQPSHSQPRTSTPSYSQPSYSQPRVTTPTYIAQTPIYYPTPTPTPVPQPQTCSVNIVPTQISITKGNFVNISWTSTNASYVTLTGGTYSNTRVANSGTNKVYPTVNTTYTVKCFTAQGLTNTASSYITVTTPTPTYNFCTNGATNYPYCTIPTPPQNYCTNGATNYPYCTIPTNNYCANGATNYPTCTYPTNYVYCNGVSYPAGYVCPVINQYNLSVSTTGASAYSTTATLYGYVNPYGQNATIWFDYGTNSSNLQWQTTKQNTSYAGQFSGNLSGLTCGTRYYYRAAAQNSYETKYGNTLSFVTSACQNNGGTADNSVVTRLATSVSYYNGQLNGAFVKGNQYTTSCASFFDYGTDYNLSTRTSGQNLYPSYTVNYFSQAVSNLTPNTTYYVRAGVTCYDGTKYGNTVSFKTPALKYTYVGKTKTIVKTNYVAPKTEVTETPTCLCDTQSYVSLVIENLDGSASVGKLVNYKVVYKNTSKENLKNVVIRVVLPEEMTIYSSDKGQYTKGGKTLVYTIASLPTMDEGSFILTATVDKNTQVGRQMIVNAYANYTVPTVVKAGVALTGEVTAYIISVADNGTNLNPANTDDTSAKATTSSWSSLFPASIIDWVIFVIVFLVFLAALRYMFGSVRKTTY